MAREEKYGIGRSYTRERESSLRLLEERERREIEILEEKVKKDAAVSRKEAIEKCLPPRRDGRKK